MKIEPKDLKKYLSLKGKFVVTGKVANSLTKDWFIKFGRGFKKVALQVKDKVVDAAVATKDAVVNTAVAAKDKVVDTTVNVKDKVVDKTVSTMDKIKTTVLPSEEVIQAKLEETREKKIEKLDNKKQELENLKTRIEKDDETKIELKDCYLKQVNKELNKLNNKIMNVSSKGLSVYALTKLTLQKVKDNIKNKWNKHLEKKAEKNQTQELEANKRILEENLKSQFRIQEETKAILAQHPELERFFQEIYEKQYNKENTESTGKTL